MHVLLSANIRRVVYKMVCFPHCTDAHADLAAPAFPGPRPYALSPTEDTGQAPMAEALLDSVVTDRDIAIIAQEYLTKWEEISPFLKLKNVTDENIRRTPGDYQEQKKALLREWKRLHSSNATFRVLILAAEEAQNMMLADELRCMLENKRVYRADSNGSSGRDKTDLPGVFTEGKTSGRELNNRQNALARQECAAMA